MKSSLVFIPLMAYRVVLVFFHRKCEKKHQVIKNTGEYFKTAF